MTKTLLAAAALALALTTPAFAETYNYACQVDNTPPNNGVHTYSAKIDTTAKTITWRGKVYRNLKTSGDADAGTFFKDCAKYCFMATAPNFVLSIQTATQGYASLQLAGTKPLEDGLLNEAECNLIRDN
jgi:hypothetical protein